MLLLTNGGCVRLAGILGPRHPHLLNLNALPRRIGETGNRITMAMTRNDNVDTRHTVIVGDVFDDVIDDFRKAISITINRPAVDEDLSRSPRRRREHKKRVPKSDVI